MPQEIKDHLAHLRTVHFALVLASVVLAISSFETLGSSRSQAFDELTSINNAATQWDENALQPPMQAIAKELDAKLPNSESELLWIAYDGTPPVSATFQYKDFELRWFSGEWVHPSAQNLRNPLILQSERHGILPLESLTVVGPTNAEEFKVIWDALYSSAVGYAYDGGIGGAAAVIQPSSTEGIGSGWRITRGVFRNSLQGVTRPAATCSEPHLWEVNEQSQGMTKELAEVAPSLYDTSTHAPVTRMPIPVATPSLALYLQCPDATVIVPVAFEVEKVGGALQSALRTRYSANWPTGTFATTFPGLAQLPDELLSLPFGSLADVLRDETKITSDRIEVLGAKIPIDRIITFGVPILLCVQGYLLLLLRVLRSGLRGNRNDSIVWVGVYSDISARVATLISMALLPTLVVARLSALAHVSLARYVLQVVLSTSISLLLAVMSVIELIKVWNNFSTIELNAEPIE